MRKEIGFRIRDMWYNLGECLTLNRPLYEVFLFFAFCSKVIFSV